MRRYVSVQATLKFNTNELIGTNLPLLQWSLLFLGANHKCNLCVIICFFAVFVNDIIEKMYWVTSSSEYLILSCFCKVPCATKNCSINEGVVLYWPYLCFSIFFSYSLLYIREEMYWVTSSSEYLILSCSCKVSCTTKNSSFNESILLY